MTEPVASMPPSILRELVLRLIIPDGEIPIEATSALDFREKQVTRRLKPSSAQRLSRSTQAVEYLERYAASRELVDEVANLFLDAAERVSEARGASSLNPFVLPGLVFEEVLYTYRLVKLGASKAILERLQVQLVIGGWSRQAEDIARRLDRSLTRDEVLRLAENYTKGAVQSSSQDEYWPAFAERHLGGEGRRIVEEQIQEKARRWENSLY